MIRFFPLLLTALMLVSVPVAAQKLYVTPDAEKQEEKPRGVFKYIPRIFVPKPQKTNQYNPTYIPQAPEPAFVNPTSFDELDPEVLNVYGREPHSVEEMLMAAAYKRSANQAIMRQQRAAMEKKLARQQQLMDAWFQRKLAAEAAPSVFKQPAFAQQGAPSVHQGGTTEGRETSKKPVVKKSTIYVTPGKVKKPPKVFTNYR